MIEKDHLDSLPEGMRGLASQGLLLIRQSGLLPVVAESLLSELARGTGDETDDELLPIVRKIRAELKYIARIEELCERIEEDMRNETP